MKSIVTCMAAAAALCAGAIFTSCDSTPDIAGQWRSNNPEDITVKAPMASMASSVTTLEFQRDQSKGQGTVTLSDSYEITAAGQTGVTVSGTASVNGRWETDVDDQDDLVLTYDMATLKVDLSGDSASVAVWRPEVERLFRADINRFSVVEDVEVNKGATMMTLEVKAPETKLHFRKVGA